MSCASGTLGTESLLLHTPIPGLALFELSLVQVRTHFSLTLSKLYCLYPLSGSVES